MPDAGPLGETFFDAKAAAIADALLANSPSGGLVELVVTLALHFFLVAGMETSPSGVHLDYQLTSLPTGKDNPTAFKLRA